MAFGRLDQLLYPFYVRDKERDPRRRTDAELLACTFYKIGERRLFAADDVVNIAVGGVKQDGSGGVNELSYLILQAVEECHIPGPESLGKAVCGRPGGVCGCLPARHRDRYRLSGTDERRSEYSRSGPIRIYAGGLPRLLYGRLYRKFYPGKAASLVGRPLPFAEISGICLKRRRLYANRAVSGNGHTARRRDRGYGGLCWTPWKNRWPLAPREYMAVFRNENARYNRDQYVQPFLSCFCRDCIGRGLDINDGGTLYPSVHGVCGMGIATMADSLAAIEQVVFQQKKTTLAALREALKANFDGYEALRADLLAAPKYGNNLDFVDKYAVWFVECHARIFSRYKTRDGGGIYLAIASNVQNISAGLEVAATPDGRLNGTPLSDAASPMHGRDRDGPTTAFHSLAKPDYTLAGAGTVVNQKIQPGDVPRSPKRACLSALIRAYFQMGGQEVQINSISREMLRDAMMHPDEYRDLVVRVSGFSAYYISLDQTVQEDILMRTEHG